jgi:hypothetical protein
MCFLIYKYDNVDNVSAIIKEQNIDKIIIDHMNQLTCQKLHDKICIRH